jgi:hypothetical protein
VTENAYDRPDLALTARSLVMETADALASGMSADALLAMLYTEMLKWSTATDNGDNNEPAATMANVIVAAGQLVADLVEGDVAEHGQA